MLSSNLEATAAPIKIVFGMTAEDVGDKRKNGIETVYMAEYAGGVEITVEFADEDYPGMCGLLDCTYDCIRRPLYGRKKDIETFFVLQGDKDQATVHFPGTYSGPTQNYQTKNPKHLNATVPPADFEREACQDDKDGALVVWVNTWNHLFGPKNNNPDMELVRVSAPTDFVLRLGFSRHEVDAQYKGCITSVSDTIPEKIQTQLGQRKR